MLYSRLPRSSAWPSSRTCVFGFCARNWPCACSSALNSRQDVRGVVVEVDDELLHQARALGLERRDRDAAATAGTVRRSAVVEPAAIRSAGVFGQRVAAIARGHAQRAVAVSKINKELLIWVILGVVKGDRYGAIEYCISTSRSWPRERAPHGLLHVSGHRRDLRLDATVGADRCQHAATVLFRRVDDLRTVRREARRLVEPAVRVSTCRSPFAGSTTPMR